MARVSSTQHHALQRSLSAMTIGVLRRQKERADDRRPIELTEREHQFQLPVSGTAYQGIVWTKRDVDFDTIFFGATGYRDSEFERPQVHYGFVIEPADKNQPVLPIIPTLAVEWKVDDMEATYGATLHIGVHSPTVDPVDFEGFLHITFQGWGSPLENSTEGDS